MTNRRERNRKPARRPPFRDPKPVILIVCEGERTEYQYLKGFRAAFRNSRVDIEISDEHGVPLTLVRVAKQRKQEAEDEARRQKDENIAFDSVWCVCDVDDHPGLPDAKQMARDNGIEMAVSNPCFELWLLLHFRENPGMQHRDKIREMLCGYVADYDKHVKYSIFESGYIAAVTRAKRMDQAAREADDEGRNPTTGVYRLTEAIRS